MMEEKIREYVKRELERLSNGVKSVELTGVYPSVLESVIGGFDWSEADTNGWQVDYWLTTDKYDISGSMYYGTATISLKE